MSRLTRTLGAMLAVVASLAVAPAALAGTTVLSGVVQLQHGDPRTPGAPATYVYSLRTTHGSVALRLAGPSSLTPGTYVRVRGTRRGAVLRVTGVRRVAPPSAAARRLLRPRFALAAAPATPQLAVVLINFSNDMRQPFTATSVANALFNNPDSVAAYYDEQSHGRTTLTGTVFGWYTIAAPGTDCDTNFQLWATQARAMVGNAINAYSNVMYIFPTLPQAQCGWAGLGDLPGSETWINGYLQMRVMAHELGHNFGVHHANSLTCTVSGSRVALAADANCTSNEYGDPFSVMGSGSTRQFPAFHKGELGWLQPTSTYTVASSGTYTIAAAESDTAATQLLRIPRPGGRALYVDLRQTYGTYFDSFLPGSSPVSGVMLRTGVFDYDRTQPSLVDATPATSSYNDAALASGQALTDPATGITITTGAITDGVATVDVTVPGTGFAPGAPPNVTSQPAAGGGADIAWGAASDDVGVASYRLYRNGVQIGGSIAGQAYHDPSAAGLLRYAVAAVDGGGLAGSIAAAPLLSIGDAVAPTAPTHLVAAVVGSTVKLTWTASTDNVGVTAYEIRRTGRVPITTTATSAQDTATHGGESYVYSVVARDAADNVSAPSEPLPVTIDDGTPPSAVSLLKVAVLHKPWGATLTWRAATDNVAVTGYRVYRDAALIGTVPGSAYTDPGLSHVEMAVYAVAAIDGAGNEGPRTRVSAIPTDVDLTAPAAPRSLKAKALAKRRVRLTWPAATDDVGVVRYDVVVSGRVVLKTSKRAVTIKLAGRRGKRVTIYARAVDAAGNRSKLVRVVVRLR